MQDGLSGYPGWGDFSPFPNHATGSRLQRNMTGMSHSTASFHTPHHSQSLFNNGEGGRSGSGGGFSDPHQHQHPVSRFGQQDGGLNSSCSSDKFSNLDDMVSKIVDDDPANMFALTSPPGQFSAGSAAATDDDRSQTTSDVFSFDE